MNKRKKILILGATGQDGSFMAKFMHEKNYSVHCVIRKSATGNLKNLEKLINKKNFFIHHGDLLDLISESVSSSAPYFPNSRHNEVIAAVRALFSSKAR